jgi:hypothetical protein
MSDRICLPVRRKEGTDEMDRTILMAIFLYLMELTNSPLRRRWGAEEEISPHVLCECQALAALRHEFLGSLFLDPKDVKSLSLGAL